MKNTAVSVPEIIRNLNPVTEHFGSVSQDTGNMQVPNTIEDIPCVMYQALTEAEQAICDMATD